MNFGKILGALGGPLSGGLGGAINPLSGLGMMGGPMSGLGAMGMLGGLMGGKGAEGGNDQLASLLPMLMGGGGLPNFLGRLG